MRWILDCRDLLLRQEDLDVVCALLWQRLERFAPDFVAGVVMSGAPLVAGLMHEAGRHGHRINGLLVRKEVHSYGLRKQVEGPIPWSRARVILVDDVLNTGRTMTAAAEALAPMDVEIVAVGVMVDNQMAEARRRLGVLGAQLEFLVQPGDLGMGVNLPAARPVTPAGSWELSRLFRSDVASIDRVAATAGGFMIRSGTDVVHFDRTGALLECEDAGTGCPSRPDAAGSAGDGGDDVVAGEPGGWVTRNQANQVTWRKRVGHLIPYPPLRVGEVVVVCAPPYVVGLELASGVLIWVVNAGAWKIGSPVAVADRVLVPADERVCEIDVRSGHVFRQWRLDGPVGHIAVAGSLVLAGTSERLVAFRREPGTDSGLVAK